MEFSKFSNKLVSNLSQNTDLHDLEQLKIQVALIGAPNVGKTTLFNTLTGEHNSVGNWDGVTTELAEGEFRYAGSVVKVHDLPGCYSLIVSAKMSLEEKLVCEYCRANHSQLFINVVSLENLHRDLYLTLQLLEQGHQVLLLLNLTEHVAPAKGILENLSNNLKCEVVCYNALKSVDLLNLQKMIVKKISSLPKVPNSSLIYKQYFPTKTLNWLNYIKTRSEVVIQSLGDLIKILEGDRLVTLNYEGLLPKAIYELPPDLISSGELAWDVFFAKKRHEFIKEQLICLDHKPKTGTLAKQVPNFTKAIDRVLLNKYLGLPIFMGMIYGIFLLVSISGDFSQRAINCLYYKFFLVPINKLLLFWATPAWVKDLWNEGLAVGFNTLLNFIPALFIMYIFLFILENSGYIARVVFLMDRFMRFLGLSGRSIIPMVIGFSCNVPAILGAKMIEQKRDRIITILMTPFMSCSARLVTYSVFANAFFAANYGNVIFYLYLIGILAAIFTGSILHHLLSGSCEPLVMDLPNYAIPNFWYICRKAGYRIKKFMLNASIVVIGACCSIASIKRLWLFQEYFLNSSGFKWILKVFQPIGIAADNWQAVASLLSGLVAKEVIIGSLHTFYGVKNNEMVEVLCTKFGDHRAAFAYLLFILLAFPCISVITSISKELQLRWAIFAFFWTTSLAYIVAGTYYQIATFMDHPGSSGCILTSLLGSLGLILVGLKVYWKVWQTKEVNLVARQIPIFLES